MTDPRALNCQAFHRDAAGKVDGVELQYRPLPSAPYELVKVELIPEAAAGGQQVATCTVLDKTGIQTGERVYLAWPWPDLKNFLLPGNPRNEHVISNGYNPPDLGPLALFVGDAAQQPISDVIGGLGLPINRHVCYRVTWRERGDVTPDPGTEPTDETLIYILDTVTRLDTRLARLALHLGLPD